MTAQSGEAVHAATHTIELGIWEPIKIMAQGKVEEMRRRFGGEWKDEFPFDPEWHNLNHGSFGSIPIAIRDKLREYQDQVEARPDRFIRYDYPRLLDESREAVARLIKAPVDSVVFVSNATEGLNTVFRNLVWAEDGRDVIMSFSTIYEACGKMIDYIVDYYGGLVTHYEIGLEYPVEDETILQAFRDAVNGIQSQGKRARACLFDVVSSRPGVVFPWEAMVAECKNLGVMSIVDGAQGIGMLPLDMVAVDADVFVSNCHKWLYVPRGCAVLYVPVRNQGWLPTTLATSHGYVAKADSSRGSPLPPNSKSAFVNNFEFVGTKDNSPYLCVKDAIEWRRHVLGGEDAIIAHLWNLNKTGVRHVADVLGTQMLENSAGTLTNCAMGNVALPIWIGQRGKAARDTDVVVAADKADKAFQWMAVSMVQDYKTFISLFVMGKRFWVRLSAQIYLDMSDYEFAAKMLTELTQRAGKHEYLGV
ncbi:hypothetical protein CDD81_2350 [Ophiocordyceps australis]|uniref:Aminotransferase class V domain-containing protein n=1 Tax=Ophiocordyceps australis TaxID=1399860 RepID=A0A2C5XZB2_9HYPO|nr:hypothetical protein CDD81_2350 [Ophiocordyceps australis]